MILERGQCIYYGEKDYCSTFEESETVSQFPPLRENLPLPMRNRISSGVSLGPFAKGVYLHRAEEEKKERKKRKD